MIDAENLQGTVLFAHGSRDPLWRLPVEAIASRARQLDPQRLIGCAYLELTEPDLKVCVAGLIDRGVRRLNVVPLFLGVGKHAREDLPVMMADLKATYPGVAFSLQNAVGEDQRLVDLIAKIAIDPL